LFPDDAQIGTITYFVEIVKLLWLHKTIHERPPLEVLPGTQTHGMDVEFSVKQPSQNEKLDVEYTYAILSITLCDGRFPSASLASASGRTTESKNWRIAFWNRL
jgi:hypothetical protein